MTDMASEQLERASESSKLRESIRQFGNNSYYYAHSRPIEIPPNAIIREGDGVVTGGQPVLLASETKSIGKPKRKITTFSWFDDNDKIKIYLEDLAFIEQLNNLPDDQLQHEFTSNGFRFETSDAIFAIDNLEDSIDVSASNFRISPNKTRLTIVLKKSKPNKTWHSLRSSKP